MAVLIGIVGKRPRDSGGSAIRIASRSITDGRIERGRIDPTAGLTVGRVDGNAADVEGRGTLNVIFGAFGVLPRSATLRAALGVGAFFARFAALLGDGFALCDFDFRFAFGMPRTIQERAPGVSSDLREC
jgi:hypothetical protein